MGPCPFGPAGLWARGPVGPSGPGPVGPWTRFRRFPEIWETSEEFRNYPCSLSCDRNGPRAPHGVAAAAGAPAEKGGSGAVADGVARDRCRWVEYKKLPAFEG